MNLNGRQKAWLHSANHDERLAFMAKGPAEVKSVLDENTRDLNHRPALRGVIWGNSCYKAELEAQTRADEVLSYLQRQDLPILNEEAIGIDGTNQMIADQCEAATLNVSQLVHLGALIGSGAGYDAMPDEIHDNLVDVLYRIAESRGDENTVGPHEATFLGSLPEPFKDEVLGILGDPDIDLTDDDALDDATDAFFQAAIDHGDVGYLAVASTPAKDYNEDRTAATFSWGRYYTQLLYGGSLSELVSQGAQWAEAVNEPTPAAEHGATRDSGMSM